MTNAYPQLKGRFSFSGIWGWFAKTLFLHNYLYSIVFHRSLTSTNGLPQSNYKAGGNLQGTRIPKNVKPTFKK